MKINEQRNLQNAIYRHCRFCIIKIHLPNPSNKHKLFQQLYAQIHNNDSIVTNICTWHCQTIKPVGSEHLSRVVNFSDIRCWTVGMINYLRPTKQSTTFDAAVGSPLSNANRCWRYWCTRVELLTSFVGLAYLPRLYSRNDVGKLDSF